MLDQFDRNIDYMRISVTDRCNLRCRYCMPEGAVYESHEAILRYEEILRNILYAGVWTQFDAIALKDKEEAMKRTQPASDAQEGGIKE